MSTEVHEKQSQEDGNEAKFILLKDQVGSIVPAKGVVGAVVNAVNAAVRRSNFNLLKGSLFKLSNVNELNRSSKFNFVSVDNAENCLPNHDLKDFRLLTKKEYGILLAVPTSNARYDVACTSVSPDGESKLAEACSAKEGDYVNVHNDRNGIQKGVIKSVGESTNKTKKGVFFHVSFEQPLCDNNLGETNLDWNKNSHCVPVSEIDFFSAEDYLSSGCKNNEKQKTLVNKANKRENKSLAKPGNSREKVDKSKEENDSTLVTNSIGLKSKRKSKKNKVDSTPNKICVGKRVVCYLDDDTTPVAGIVRYFGKTSHDGVMAGVELDSMCKNNKFGNYYKGRKLFDCDDFKGLIIKPDKLSNEEEFPAEKRRTYVTLTDRDSGIHELEKKELMPSEVKNTDPYKEQVELFKKHEESKLDSLNRKHTQNYLQGQDVENREKDIECEILSHDKGIQGIKKALKIPNQMPDNHSNKQNPNLFNVGTPKMISSETDQKNLKKESVVEKKENDISPVSVDEFVMQEEFSGAISCLQIGDMVEVMIQHKKFYGVLNWKGIDERYPHTTFAGIELESSIPSCSDGTFLGQKKFKSPLRRAFFIKLHQCKPDSRFQLQDMIDTNKHMSVKGSIMPNTKPEPGHLGRDKGIQGHYNSCYMDSTLFAMFGYSHVFDVVLNRKGRLNDIKDYDTVQTILKEQIVNPLRKNGFVSHQSGLELRKYLNELGNIGGFMTDQKDPEEFIVLLFEKVLKVDAFVKLRVNDREEGSHLYQIFFPKEEKNPLPSIQYLLEYSFLSSNLQLAEVPSVMILQMPRFGQQKLYQRIQITSKLDITPLLADKIHLCVICAQSATCHCPDCACLLGWEIVHTYLCESCWHSVHKHPKRNNHQQRIPIKSLNSKNNAMSEHVLLELFAVVCIEKSHYVSFVKCGTDEDEKWLFFDSMADRIGGENGHNIPEVTMLDNLKYYLNGNPLEICELDKKCNEQIMRVFDDSSLCFYYNKGLTMYR